MNINGREIDVNVEEEISGIKFDKCRIRGSELIACSPFRNESTPSFSLNLESGLWIDRGAISDLYKSGNIIKLLAYFRGESFEDVANYLLEKYSTILKDTDGLVLELNLDKKEHFASQNFLSDKIKNLKKVSEYLSSRKISVEIQKRFETGFDDENNVISLVWRDKRGDIANIKYRSVLTKKFYYESDCKPIHDNVFGIYQVIQDKAKEVWVCESEIDSLTLWSIGIPSIALGGANITDVQKDIILSSGIESIVIATDNDRVGNEIRQVLIDEFLPHIKVYGITFPKDKKDINELSEREMVNVLSTKSRISLSFNLI